MNIKIRRFQSKDAIKAANTIKKAQRITLKSYYPKKLIEVFCKRNTPSKLIEKSKKRPLYVTELGDRIVGYMGFEKNFLKSLFVHPDYQGKGIGKKLFDKFKSESKKKGYKKIRLESSHFAIKIYKRWGCKKIKVNKKVESGIKFENTLMESRIL